MRFLVCLLLLLLNVPFWGLMGACTPEPKAQEPRAGSDKFDEPEEKVLRDSELPAPSQNPKDNLLEDPEVPLCSISPRSPFSLTEQSPLVAPTIKVVVLHDHDGHKGELNCVGVAGLKPLRIPLATESEKYVELLMPRILLAKHCIALEDEDSKIIGIRFEPSDNIGRIEYSVSRSGALQHEQESSFWSIDLESLKQKDPLDECSAEQVQARSNRSKSEKHSELIPCFTSVHDRFVIAPKLETEWSEMKLEEKLAKFEEVEGQWIQALQSEASWSLKDLFKLGNVPVLEEITHVLNWRGFDNMSQVIGSLDAHLKNLRVTRLVRRAEGQKSLLVERPKEGWEQSLRLYMNQETDFDSPEQQLNVVGLSALTMRQLTKVFGAGAELRKGDSGALLIGSFEEYQPQFLTMRSFDLIIGTLSTVGGESVCSGDDLACCERY